MTPRVTIIVVNYNSGAHLPRCMQAVKNQTVTDFECLIVDNASNDDSLDRARAETGYDARFRVLEQQDNLGFAAGNNLAAREASGDWIATLNPDAFPEADWLEAILETAGRHPDVAMFGSTQLLDTDPDRLDGNGDRYFAAGVPWRDRSWARFKSAQKNGHDSFETFAPCAAAALYRTDVFRSVDGFDERFFCFVEDVDLAFRLRRRGHRCLQAIDATVHHVGGGAGGGSHSNFARYHGTRNLIWCFTKNMPLALLIPLLPVHALGLGALLAIAVRQGNGCAVARGIRDGVLGVRRIGRDTLDEREQGASTIMGALDWTPYAYLRNRRERM